MNEGYSLGAWHPNRLTTLHHTEKQRPLTSCPRMMVKYQDQPPPIRVQLGTVAFTPYHGLNGINRHPTEHIQHDPHPEQVKHQTP